MDFHDAAGIEVYASGEPSTFLIRYYAQGELYMGFISRSLLVLFMLYGLVFVIGDVALLHAAAPLWAGAVFVVVLIGGQYLIAPQMIERFFTIQFNDDAVPAAQREFVQNLCRQRGLPMPKMGIIESGTPNAFAFGRLRSDARVVVTRGLLNICTDDEANAVLAHEVGHIAHYDFAVMAMAAMAPLMLYQIYFWSRNMRNQGRVVAYAAYVAYWVAQLLVLMLNRTREYGADHFSAEVTREPSMLASALVKIGYGMVAQRSESERVAVEGGNKKEAAREVQLGSALGLMGIAAASGGDAMALGMNNAEEAARVMRWDLVNPWSRVYELGSTHPLTAMRLRRLNAVSAKMGQELLYPLPKNGSDEARIRWIGFPLEFAFWLAPLACGFLLVSWAMIGRSLRRAGVVLPHDAMPWLLLTLGVTWAAKIAFRYHGKFVRKNVRELLDDISVSQMRPRAVEITGEVIGHGVPGAFWSADLVLQDATGMMFLLYRSAMPFGRLFFALRHVNRMIGEQVTVQGWYRRGLKPYIEIAKVEARIAKAYKGRRLITLFGGEGADAPPEYEDLVERSYSRWIQLAAAGACAGAGVLWLLARS